MRASSRSGEATPPTSFVTSPPRPSTLPSRTTTSRSSRSRRTTGTGGGSEATSLPEVPPVPLRSSSSTRSTTPVPVSPTTPSRPPRAEASASSTASSTSTARHSPRTVLAVSTVASSLRSSVSSSTVVSSPSRFFFFSFIPKLTIGTALVFTTRLNPSSWSVHSRAAFWHRSCSAGVLLSVLVSLRTRLIPFG